MPPTLDPGSVMTGVIPYLYLNDARRAVDFYREAFAAVVYGDVTTMPGDPRIANVILVVNGRALMLADAIPECGQSVVTGPCGITMQLVAADGDTWWQRAVAAGCEATCPFETQFLGDRYGALRDPFGVDWAINEPSSANLAKAKQVRP